MKKTYCAVAIAAMIGFGFLLRTESDAETSTSNLKLVNIEALADGESNKNCTFEFVSISQDRHELHCSGYGSQCCVMN